MATVITDPDDPALNHLFTSYTDTAWKLATLPHYHRPGEQRAIKRFLNGSATIPKDPWLSDIVTPALTKGKDIGRVHVIERTTDDDGQLALDDYLRFTLHRYKEAKAAGETIRIAWTEPGSWPSNIGQRGDDFWLFDETTDHGVLLKQQYYPDGAFRQAILVEDPAQVARATKIKRAALVASKPFYP